LIIDDDDDDDDDDNNNPMISEVTETKFLGMQTDNQ
jgi:hypothetical protein